MHHASASIWMNKWQYVGYHAGRMVEPDKEKGDFWLLSVH